VADTGVSKLTNLNFPRVLDLNSDQLDVLYSASVSDPDGVRQVTLRFDRDVSTIIGTYDFQIIHGYGSDWDDGDNEYTSVVLPENLPGEVNIEYVEITDLLGNKTKIYQEEIQNLGLPDKFEIQSAVSDTTPPTLSLLELPEFVDVSSGSTTFEIFAEAEDRNKIRNIVVWFDHDLSYAFSVGVNANFYDYSLLLVNNEVSRVSEKSQLSVERFLSDLTPAGNYDVTKVYVEDVYGNQSTYTNEDLRRLGLPTSMEVISSVSTAETTYIQELPKTIQIREGETLDLNIDLVGLEDHYTNLSYRTSLDGGTASASDLTSVSSSLYLSYASSQTVNDRKTITLTASHDELIEDTETAFLIIETRENIPFQDGGTFHVIEIQILDESWKTGSGLDDNIEGTAAAEELKGEAGNDTVFGGDGDDSVSGGTGSDWLSGGEGADVIDGGAGVDTVDYSSSPSGVTLDLSGGYGSVPGVVGWLFQWASRSAASGAGGHAEGDVVDRVENIIGSDFNDNLVGNYRSNLMDGHGGDDTLAGGAGADVFVYETGHLKIADFQGAEKFLGLTLWGADRLDLRSFALNSIDELETYAQQESDRLVLSFSSDQSVTLLGVKWSELEADQFMLF
jgi:Ca2+-binding RTX toxin-like protein